MVVHNRDSLLITKHLSSPSELIIRAVEQKFDKTHSNDEDEVNSDMESVTDSVSKTTIKRTCDTASLSSPNKGKSKKKVGGGGLKSADDKPVSNYLLLRSIDDIQYNQNIYFAGYRGSKASS